ncbi:MAG TPA: peptidyl-prolyl cis-trans isomerase [Solirubrobacteraceae bacterium]|nr:peptidyl-prolyl cis-trans isomerase [Solirubrobacteraceae bacterium]
MLPSPLHRILAVGAVLISVAGLSACGGTPSVVAVRVGAVTITRATVEHWMSVTAKERPLSPRELRWRALDFLIASQWVIGEAAADGIEVSDGESERRLEQEKRELFRNGEAGFQAFLRDTGQAVADVRLRLEVELAATKLRRWVTRDRRKLSKAQIAAYYSRHRGRFGTAERRYYEIDNLPTEEAARKVRGEIEAGRSFASMTLRESLQRVAGAGAHEAEKAIFSAKPNILTGPVKVDQDYSLFEVTRIAPATQESLAQARTAIEAQLTAEQQKRTLAQFIRAWRRRWIPRTDCRPGFVVPKCRQYAVAGTSPPEDPLTFD